MKSLFVILLFSSIGWADIVKEARSAFFKWDFESARCLFEQSLRERRDPSLLFPLAECYQKLGILHKYKEIPTIYPNIRDGLFYLHLGSFTEAYSAFEKAEPPYSYIGMGWAKRAEGDLKMAEELYVKAKESEPSSHLSYIHLSQLYFIKGNEESALSVIEEGIKNVYSPDLFLQFIDYLVKKGEEEDVRNILLSLHRKEPKNIFIKEKLGIALLAKGYSIEEVLSMIEKNEADALYLEGILSIASQQFYLMAGCKFAEAAERDPSFLLSKMRELWVYKEIGLKKNAEEVYCQLLQEIPGSGLCDLYMSKLHTNIGEPETATLYAKRAVRKEPLLSVAYLALANAHYYENRFISALLSYRKGLFLSADRSHLYSYLQEAFCRRYFPMFAAGYLIVWAITLFLLLLVHYVGIFLIRGYPTLSRYVVKKRWLFYLYIMNTGILFLSCVFGKETFRFIPLNILKEIFLFLTIILPIAIFSILGLAILLSFAVKWPKLRIYLSFVLLDFSLDIAIILMMASLIPVFCDYPKVFTAFAAFGIIFRRFGVAALILAIFLFYLWYSTSINRGYSLIEKGEMDKGISLFRRLRSSIGFIFWLEPTYSDMVASAIMGEVYALTKREKWEEISMLWKPIEKSLKDWWPLNVRARFFYEWSVALSKAKTDNVSEAKRDVERMLEVSEFEKRRPAIEALSALIKAKEPKIEHLKDKELKRILRGIR